MQAIGIDIGGTKTAVALVNRHGRITAKVNFPTKASEGFDLAVVRIRDAIDRLLLLSRLTTKMVAGVGIGCSGPVDPLRGTIHNPYTLPSWDGCDLTMPLRQRFGVPIRMENDADAAALGEYRFGAGRDAEPLVMLTFGTGIGFSAIINGQIYRGAGGAHPELGHIPTLAKGPNCYCGIGGCFESLASGTAIQTQGKVAGYENSRKVFHAADAGDTIAKSIVDNALAATSTAAWTLLHSFLPSRIILGGGMMDDQYDRFAAAIQTSIDLALMTFGVRTQVVKAALGDNAGVIGAASLVMIE